ncbi:MAG TPA: YceI family protein [Bacteroidota bacterium]|jgi:polyisoprenoid-binding protein YceI|nr:YceI family protein [Bacteroidota bacterium]
MKTTRKSSIIFTMLLASVFTLFARAQTESFDIGQFYPIDRGHSYIGFSIRYMGFAKVRGRFADFSGTFRYDPGDITKTSATVIIKVESIDTDLDFRDKDLKSDNWFDAAKYPVIRFQSKRVVKGNAGFDIVGDLTIRDVSKEVTLTMDYCSGVQKDIRGDDQVIFNGSTVINRKDFGVRGENWSAVKEGITAVETDVGIELTILGKQIKSENFKNRLSDPESPQAKIYSTITQGGVEAGIQMFRKLRSADGNKIHSGILNVAGYMLLKEGKVDEALQVFGENARQFPDDKNVFDSLAEAYATKGDKSAARRYYQKTLEKDPLNANAIEILRHLG